MANIPVEMSLTHAMFADSIESYPPKFVDLFDSSQPTFANYKAVTQGEIGDCWFLAPLAAIAKSTVHRHILQENFLINTGSRTYTIRLYNPYATSITIDGRLWNIPEDDENESDLFFAGQQQHLTEREVTNEQIWPSLFEKAAATLLGGYHAIDGGDPEEDVVIRQGNDGFFLLTGLPVETIRIDADFTMDVIRPHVQNGAAIVFTTKLNNNSGQPGLKTEPTGIDQSRVNLLQDHVYVVDTIQPNNTLKLYNPHGELAHLRHNIAKPLTLANILRFGERFDILPVYVGGRRTRKNKKQRKYTKKQKKQKMR